MAVLRNLRKRSISESGQYVLVVECGQDSALVREHLSGRSEKARPAISKTGLREVEDAAA
jgi:hypothetical protein